MTKEELIQKDKSFNSELFISKANIMIKKIYQSITNNTLENVDYFISDKVYNVIKKQIETTNSKNCCLIYDDISVNTSIYDIKEEMNEYKIYTDVEIKCIRYFKEKENNNILGGDSNNKVTIDKIAIFKKKVNNNETVTNRCQGCGNTYDVITNHTCPVCGRVYDLEETDYYIDELN